MTPAALAFVLILASLIWIVRRDRIAGLLVVGMCFVPSEQHIMLGTLNLYAVQILVVSAAMRLMCLGEGVALDFNRFDKLILCWQCVATVVYVIKSQDHQAALIWKTGRLVNGLGVYIVLRQLLRKPADIERIVRWFAVCVILLVPFAAYERFTGQNLFAVFGRTAVAIRDGKVRAATTFSHPILCGSFSAALIPIFWTMTRVRLEGRWLYWLGAGAAAFIVFASNSSGPILSAAGGIGFLFLYRWRRHTRRMFYGTILLVVGLHIFMRLHSGSPVWALIIRVGVIGSSTAYYRYQLIDAAMNEWQHWWLLGYGAMGADWHIKYWPWAHALFTDITNQYLLEAARGGIWAAVLFVAVCILAGRGFRHALSLHSSDRWQWLWWGWLASLISHCLSFISVNYFGQILMQWYLTLAVAALAYQWFDRMSVSKRPARHTVAQRTMCCYNV